MTVYHWIAISGVLLGPVAQLFLKLGTRPQQGPAARPYRMSTVFTLAGISVMLCSGFLYFYALKFIPLKDFAYILPFAYVFAPILSFLFLKERITRRHWSAVGLIAVGVLVFHIPSPVAF